MKKCLNKFKIEQWKSVCMSIVNCIFANKSGTKNHLFSQNLLSSRQLCSGNNFLNSIKRRIIIGDQFTIASSQFQSHKQRHNFHNGV